MWSAKAGVLICAFHLSSYRNSFVIGVLEASSKHSPSASGHDIRRMLPLISQVTDSTDATATRSEVQTYICGASFLRVRRPKVAKTFFRMQFLRCTWKLSPVHTPYVNVYVDADADNVRHRTCRTLPYVVDTASYGNIRCHTSHHVQIYANILSTWRRTVLHKLMDK